MPALLAAAPAVFSDAFAVQLAHRLRGPDYRSGPAPAWLDERLAARGTTIDIVVREELQRQGTSSATIRNAINSLRLIAAMDWTEFFERVCRSMSVLATSGAFREMDFPTRNLYRTAVEELARGSRHSEVEIARNAVAAASGGDGGRQADPGYYLFAGGRPGFEASIRYRPKPSAWLRRGCRALGVAGYAITVVAIAAAFVAGPLLLLHVLGIACPWLALLGIAGFVPASDAAMACVNRLVTFAFGATTLPGLALRAGIPAPLRTLVAVPTMLTSAASIAEQVARLEVHHLASQDGEVHFALLSDWADGPAEHADTDAALLAAATAGIERLNDLHGPGTRRGPFLPAASPPGLERGRGRLDRLGAQARQAARAEPPVARRQRYELHRLRRSCRPACATWSRSTRTRGCRVTRCGGWSASLPIR